MQDETMLVVTPLIGGGEMGQLVRETDWSATPLGDFSTWSQSLRVAMSLVLNTKGIAALYWGPEQWLLYNDAYGEALGDRHPWAFGRPMPEALPDIAPVLSPQVAEALRTGTGFAIENLPMVMHRYGRKDETYWTYSFSPIQGECPGFVGVLLLATQMTGQRKIEDALRESEATALVNANRVQLALAAGAIIGTWNWDLPTDSFTVDEAFALAFGFDPSIGHEGLSLAQVVATVHPDDQAGLADAIKAVVLRGGAYAHQYRTLRLDGQYHWLEANGRVEHAPDGTPLSFPGVLIDIGERRRLADERDRAAAALRDLNDTLEQRVTERTTELMRAEEALRQSQKVEAIGLLTGGVAHDFNNLLTVIKGSVELLRRPDVSDERRKRYTDAIADTADRAAKLTGQLLAFARRQALKPETFDAGESVVSMKSMVETLAGSNIRVDIDIAPAAHPISADRSQFDTAIINMAVNARDAMKGKGMLTMSIATASGIPAMRSHPAVKGNFVTVAVRDTGSGIVPDQIDRIFEPFFTTKNVGEGTGLGLSQVYGFAKQSGGD